MWVWFSVKLHHQNSKPGHSPGFFLAREAPILARVLPARGGRPIFPLFLPGILSYLRLTRGWASVQTAQAGLVDDETVFPRSVR